MDNYEKITFITDEGETEFFVMDQTVIAGHTYLLVTEEDIESLPEDADIEVFILKNTGLDEDEVMTYEFIEDEDEVEAVFKLFEQLYEEV